MEDNEIIATINQAQKMYPEHIVRQVGVYLVIATDENDFVSKARDIHHAETEGFYTLEQFWEKINRK